MAARTLGPTPARVEDVCPSSAQLSYHTPRWLILSQLFLTQNGPKAM
jgi:hypothetical protein